MTMSLSKFDRDMFYIPGCSYADDFAVSKQKYTKEQAIEIAKQTLGCPEPYVLSIGSAFVRHRAGVNEDNEPQAGWWLEYNEYSRSCPVWHFYRGERSRCRWEGYERIECEALEARDD